MGSFVVHGSPPPQRIDDSQCFVEHAGAGPVVELLTEGRQLPTGSVETETDTEDEPAVTEMVE